MCASLPHSQILCFLLGCLTICLIGSLIFEFVYSEAFTIYAAYYNSAQDHPVELAFLQIFSNLIVLNTFVPISLYVRWVMHVWFFTTVLSVGSNLSQLESFML